MIPARHVPYLNPASSKWYFVEWTASELGASVTIESSDWGTIADGAFVAGAPTGLAEDEDYASGLITGVRLSVSTAAVGDSFEIVNQITTSAGETLHETLPITIDTEGH